jgi:hypothetical protein
MAMRAWRVWGIGAALVGGLSVSAKPPELPGKVETDGKVPSPLAQEHHQLEPLPAPRLLPTSVLDPKPRIGPVTAGGKFSGNVIGLDAPEIPTPDLDVPIQVGFSGGRAVPPFPERPALAHDWKVRVAFEQAELHFDACELDEARPWYQEVLRLAPTSEYAKVAEERLRFGKVFPAGPGQSREPPLADGPELPRPIPAGTAGRIY